MKCSDAAATARSVAQTCFGGSDMANVHDEDCGVNDFGGRDADGAHEELEAMYEDWCRRENERAVADADEAQASAAMADVPAVLAEDAGEATTAAKIAAGACAAVDAV